MAELNQEKVRALAYELSERDGAPRGKDDEDREVREPDVLAPALPSLTPPV